MLWIAAIAGLFATAPAEDNRVQPQRQARASVTILKAATVRLGVDGGTKAEGAVVRETSRRADDGSRKRVSLVEFY